MKRLLSRTTVQKAALALAVLALLLSSGPAVVSADGGVGRTIYLPLIVDGTQPVAGLQSKFIGIYMPVYWNTSNVNTYMTQADNLAGKKHSVSGWFIDIEDNAFTRPVTQIETNNLYVQLESLWAKGYASFVNINACSLSSSCRITSYDIASGKYDSNLRQMADVYKQWVAKGGGRRAFLAPLPEMNGVNADGSVWATYGGDAGNFKLAYARIQNIFGQRGVTRDQAWWTFAPNGWSKDGHEFEKYYPGDAAVDVIGFSSYNYGFCHVAIPWQRWENYDTLYAPYLARIGVMAPSKPVILAQTGTTAQYQSSAENASAKNTWLRTNYEYLSKQPQVFGILYYDYDQSSWECNWKVTPGSTYTGYRDGASNAPFRYLSGQEIDSLIP